MCDIIEVYMYMHMLIVEVAKTHGYESLKEEQLLVIEELSVQSGRMEKRPSYTRQKGSNPFASRWSPSNF